MKLTIYVDGSFMVKNSVPYFGAGLVILVPNMSDPLSHKTAGSDTNAARLRNVAGEILAVTTSISILDKITGCTAVEFVYDYEGIEHWVTGKWRARNRYTQEYVKIMTEAQKRYSITFRHVYGHTGDKYNEQADRLAKAAIEELAEENLKAARR